MYDQHTRMTPKVNACPDRCYYIPFDTPDCGGPRERSMQFARLTEWKTQYFGHVCEEAFVCTPTEDVVVPSVWQSNGHGKHAYCNVRYPFPFTPPDIVGENPCSAYTTHFAVPDPDKRTYLVLEGVDSCCYVFCNGAFVGYTSISHNMTEFDLTRYCAAENELRVVVVERNPGSYLEDQDKFRMSGIFRDVYLLTRPEGHLTDYKIETTIEGGKGIVDVTCAEEVCMTLCDGTRELGRAAGKTARFVVAHPHLWSAESPYLYDLTLSRAGEYVREEVGIRTVEVKGKKFLLNGKPVKLRGVNRHSSIDGIAVETEQDMIDDLRLMQRHNINAIRTSHYPPSPIFPKLCDRYGIMLMVEADIETHGICLQSGRWRDAAFGQISDDPQFYPQYRERILGMYERDKNRPSVLIWSLGNESGYGRNFAAACKELKARDSRPVHYESAWDYVKKQYNAYLDGGLLDFCSRMYPTVAEVKAYAADKKMTRPFVLCEYTHAMGNSCGDVSAYWDVINRFDCLSGAFVWEWCDHAIPQERGYGYGGDFGESFSEGSFCVDGLVSPDRKTLHPSLLEVKEVYAPVTVLYENGVFRVRTRNCFEPFRGTLAMSLLENGKVVATETAPLDLAVGAEQLVTFAQKPDRAVYRTVGYSVTDDNALGLREAGAVVAQGWAELAPYEHRRVSAPARGVGASETETEATLSAHGLSLSVDKHTGAVTVEKGGKPLFASPIEPQIFHAWIDNDRNIRHIHEARGIRFAKPWVRALSVERDAIRVRGGMYAPGVTPLVEYDAVYALTDVGARVEFDFAVNPDNEFLPRVGIRFALAECAEVSYLGLGPVETYCDRTLAAHKAYFTFDPAQQSCPYIRPQDFGSHCGTEFVTFDAFDIVPDETISFAALPYSAEQLADAAHDYALVPDGKTYVSIDAMHGGVGSNSCGPALDPKWRVTGTRRLAFDIVCKKR